MGYNFSSVQLSTKEAAVKVLSQVLFVAAAAKINELYMPAPPQAEQKGD